MPALSNTICARSFSLALPTLPEQRPISVLSVHRRAMNVVDAAGQVTAIVSPELGDAPFHVVLAQPISFEFMRPGATGIMHARTLTLPALTVAWTQAAPWQPQLPAIPLAPQAWPVLNECLAAAPRYVQRWAQMNAHTITRMKQGAAALRLGLTGDAAALRQGIALLLGLGPGLTPAGDDFVLGVLASAFFSQSPKRMHLKRIVREQAAATTLLSRTWLLHATAGRFDARWHALHTAMQTASPQAICQAAKALLNVGASSGPQALAGFLFLEQH